MEEKIKSFLLIWVVVLVLNQVLIFGACFNPYCILAALPHTSIISFLIFHFSKKDDTTVNTPNANKKEFSPRERPKRIKIDTGSIPLPRRDPFKEMGDKYEKHIGARFEGLDYLVIYNGLIRGREDQGVDLISISQSKKEINLIQCKNWRNKRMEIKDIEDIYHKLQNYNNEFLQMDIATIKEYLQLDYTSGVETQFRDVIRQHSTYIMRKTLYASSDKVMDLEIGKYLTMIKPNIFRYKDMKIVIENDEF